MFKKLFGFGKAKQEEVVKEVVEEVVEEIVEDEAVEERKIEFVDDEDDSNEEASREDEEIAESSDDEDSSESEDDESETEDLKDIVKETIIDMSDVIEVINLNDSEDTDLSQEEMDEVILNISDCELVKVDSDEDEASKEAPEDQEAVEEAKESVSIEIEVEEAIEEELIDVVEEVEEPKKKFSFFEKLKSGLTKTSKAITDKIDDLLTNYGKIDEDLFEELEEILITADIGMSTTMEIIDELRDELKARKITDAGEVKGALHDVLVRILSENNNSELISSTPSIILVIGVNGAGKTTTIGKIANQFQKEGKSVMLAAGDTFRAAAIDQLQVWGERANVPVIAQQEGSDPAAVIFDAVQAAKSRKTDVLICDTAGRLHNKVNLMKELAKVFKVVEREFPDANKEVLLVLDATTGQNAINQAKTFKEAADITGIVLTKLDGTAKGGVILGINSELNIPVKLIGVGEGVDDLQKFDPVSFVDALLNMES